MGRFWVGIVATLLAMSGGSAGLAEDLVNPKDQAVAAGWAGAYAGIEYARLTGHAGTESGGNAVNYSMTGDHSGFLVGYQWHYGRTLLGLETDLQIQEVKGNRRAGAISLAQNEDFTWAAALKGRLGLTSHRFLPFVSAGLLIGERHIFNADTDRGAVKASLGWTAGGGLEWAWTKHWVTRLEYGYQHLNDKHFRLGDTDVVHNRLGLHRLNMALIWRDAPQRAGQRADHVTFAGVYAGLLTSYGWGRQRLNPDNAGPERTDLTGPGGGILLGWGHTTRNGLYWGLESDLQLLAITGKQSAAPAHRSRLFYAATVRARAGYPWQSVMPYLTGGYAISQVAFETDAGAANVDPLKLGLVCGLGIEWGLTQRLAGRLEYLRYSFRPSTVERVPIPADADYAWHGLRLGLVLTL